jgi:hypothetical protein
MILCVTIMPASPDYRYPDSIDPKSFIVRLKITIPNFNFSPITDTLSKHNQACSVNQGITNIRAEMHCKRVASL